MMEVKNKLILSADYWNDIKSKTERSESETVVAHDAFKQYCKQEATKMKENWFDSIENVQKRRIQQAQQKNHDKQRLLLQSYKRMKAEKEQERQQYLAQVRKRMFERKEYPRKLFSACLLSQVLYERDAQLEFMATLKQQTNIQNQLYDKQMQQQLDIMRQRETQLITQTHVKRQNFATDLRQQLQNNERKRQGLRRQSLEEGIEQQKLLTLMVKQDEDNERQRRDEEKKRLCKMFFDNIEDKVRFRDKLKQLEREEEILASVFNEAKNRMNETIKQKRQQLLKQKQKRSNAMQSNNKAEQVDGQQEANMPGANVQDEIEKAQETRKKAKEVAKFNCKLFDDKTKNDKKQQMDKWVMLNHFKNEQLFNQLQIDDELSKRNQYRDELIKQIHDNNDMKKSEREKENNFYNQLMECMRKEDMQFITYAEQCIANLKSQNRLTFPADKVLLEFKLKHGFLSRVCKEFVPKTLRPKKYF